MGNSVRIAMKHYLQVTDAEFQKAIRGDAESGAESGAPNCQSEQKALQNAVQQAAAASCMQSKNPQRPFSLQVVTHHAAVRCSKMS
jgi:hypothetical protein